MVRLVVSDCLNALPHGACVSAVSEVIIDFFLFLFFANDRFKFLMPQDRLALAVLRAALSPDLKASFLVFSSPRNSAVIHGFWFARVLMFLVTVTSSMHFLMQAVTVSVYSCRLL